MVQKSALNGASWESSNSGALSAGVEPPSCEISVGGRAEKAAWISG